MHTGCLLHFVAVTHSAAPFPYTTASMATEDSAEIDLGLKKFWSGATGTCSCSCLEVRVRFPQGEVLVTSVRDWLQGAGLVGEGVA